ncbi:MAG: PIG-L family deacetylase, partial [Actinomycetota bacterium]
AHGATMCAVYPDARNPFAFPGTACADLADWAVSEVWITLGAEADAAIDITANLERKIRALMCHRSQHVDPDATEERVRTWWESIAADHGLPAGASAEAFRIVDTR